MQLKRKPSRDLRRALVASSCALLGTAAGDAAADTGDWSFDAGVLHYSEADRVTATEPAVIATRDFGDGKSLSLHFVGDTLTGATPTGSMPSTKPITLTSPSGRPIGTTTAGVNPMDNNFKDLRKALTATWSQPLSHDWRVDLGGNYSIEHDFKSQGLNALFSRDFDRRNTTVSGGVSYEYDTVFPIGGIHTPLSKLPAPTTGGGGGGGGDDGGDGGPDAAAIFAADDGGGDDDTGGTDPGIPKPTGPVVPSRTKRVKGLLLGLTQVMTRNWIGQVNFSYGKSDGYLNDPYKLVTIVNAVPPPPGAPASATPLGEPVAQFYENRPRERRERALYLGSKTYLAGDVLDFSYRYGLDDWGIRSNTYELRYRWAFGGDFYLQPHVRYYHQTAADFYHRGLLSTDIIPAHISADYRLAEFSGRTVGLEWGMDTGDGHMLRIRYERYLQSGGSDPRVQIGVQKKFDLFPELKADIVQVSYTF